MIAFNFVFHKKTRSLLTVLSIIASLSVSPTILAKVNIESESPSIELNNRLDRCRFKGFTVTDEPTTEYDLRNLVEKCESKLKISYPEKDKLLNRLDYCLQKGYKEQKLPTRMTLVVLNDLVAQCEKQLGVNSNNVVIVIVIGLLFVVFMFSIASNSNHNSGSTYVDYPETDEIRIKYNQQILVDQTLLQIDQMSEPEFKRFLSDVYLKLNYTISLNEKPSNNSSKLIITTYDNSQSIVIQGIIFKSEVDRERSERNSIREAYADIRLYNANYACVFYNSYFTYIVKEEAKQLGLVLCDRDELQNLIFKYLFE